MHILIKDFTAMIISKKRIYNRSSAILSEFEFPCNPSINRIRFFFLFLDEKSLSLREKRIAMRESD